MSVQRGPDRYESLLERPAPTRAGPSASTYELPRTGGGASSQQQRDGASADKMSSSKPKRFNALTSKMRSFSNASRGIPSSASTAYLAGDVPPLPDKREPFNDFHPSYSRQSDVSSFQTAQSEAGATSPRAAPRPPSPPMRLSSKKGRRKSGLLQTLVASVSKNASTKDEKQQKSAKGWPDHNSVTTARSRPEISAPLQTNLDDEHFPITSSQNESRQRRLSVSPRPTTPPQNIVARSRHASVQPLSPSRPVNGPAKLVRRLSRSLMPSPPSAYRPEVVPAQNQETSTPTSTFNLHSFRSVRPENRRESSDVHRGTESILSGYPSVLSLESPGDEFHSPVEAPTPIAAPDSPSGIRARRRTPSGSIPVAAFRKAAARSRGELDSPNFFVDDNTTTTHTTELSQPHAGMVMPGSTSYFGGYISPQATGTRSPAEELAALEASLPRNRALMLLQRDRSVDMLVDPAQQAARTSTEMTRTDQRLTSHAATQTAAHASTQTPLQVGNELDEPSQETTRQQGAASSIGLALLGDTPSGQSTSTASSTTPDGQNMEPFPHDQQSNTSEDGQDGRDISDPSSQVTAVKETPEVNGAGIGLSTFPRQRHASSASLSAKEKRDEVKAFHQQHAQALSEALATSKADDNVVSRIAWPTPPCVNTDYYARLPAMHQHSLYTQHCRAADFALAEYMRLMTGVVPNEAMIQPTNLFGGGKTASSRRNSAPDFKRSQSLHSRSQSHSAGQHTMPGTPKRRSLASMKDAANGGGAGTFGDERVPPLPIAPIPPLLTFVTGNANKVREVKSILIPDGDPIRLFLTNQDLDLPEVQGTPNEVALAKCRAAVHKIKGPCLTEDTALVFSAFGDLPGPYIKFFSAGLGNANLARLLHGYSSNHAATAICTFGLAMGPKTEPVLFEGRVDGTIVAPRGSGNFGWDAIFQPKGSTRTFAEMTAEQKAAFSHRGRALTKLRAYLRTHPIRLEVGGTNPGKPYAGKPPTHRDSSSSYSSQQPASSDVQLPRGSRSLLSMSGSDAQTASSRTMPSSPTTPSSSAFATAAPSPRSATTVRRHRRISAALVDRARGSLKRGGSAAPAGESRGRDVSEDGVFGGKTPTKRNASEGS